MLGKVIIAKGGHEIVAIEFEVPADEHPVTGPTWRMRAIEAFEEFESAHRDAGFRHSEDETYVRLAVVNGLH